MSNADQPESSLDAAAPVTEQPGNPADTRPQRGWKLPAGLLVTLAAAGAAVWLSQEPALPQGISSAEYQTAAEQFRDRYGREPDRLDVLSFAAELAVVDGRIQDAIACFSVIPSSDSRYGLSSRLQEGHLLLDLNRAADAEAAFRKYLSLAASTPNVTPLNIYAARRRLAFILSVELRFEDRQALLRSAHESGIVDVFDSKQFFFPHLLIWNSTTGRLRLAEFLKVDPDNRDLRLAQARYLTSLGQTAEAQSQLKLLLKRKPDDLPAIAALLESYYETGDSENLQQLLRDSPAYRIAEPWLLTRMRGHSAMEQQNWELAVTRFAEVLAADRTNPWAQSAIARACEKLQNPGMARTTQARAYGIAKIRAELARED
ncbi:MAG: tetratricopeptide repeat protein, partial [Planctomycetaceae bacterium]